MAEVGILMGETDLRQQLDAYFERATGRSGSGIADYIQRLRKKHWPHVLDDGTYTGCRCGAVMCSKDCLLFWCGELVKSYEAKVEELAQETARVAAVRQETAQQIAEKIEAKNADSEQRWEQSKVDDPLLWGHREGVLAARRECAALARETPPQAACERMCGSIRCEGYGCQAARETAGNQ